MTVRHPARGHHDHQAGRHTCGDFSRRGFISGAAALIVPGCGTRLNFAEGENLDGGPVRNVVVATNAQATPDGPERNDTLALSLLAVETTAHRAPGALAFSGPEAFALKSETPVLPADLGQALLQTRQPDDSRVDALVVWVHGFNNTPSEAVARHVQIMQDVGHEGAAVSFVWPSKGAGNGYIFDRESALFSRAVLADFLLQLRSEWSGPIIVIAHSLGGFLTMEALARLRLMGQKGDVIDGIILVQPDISPDVFAAQVRDAAPLPRRSVLMISNVDPALRVSARLAGQQDRLGSTADPDAYRELGMFVVDLSGTTDAENYHLTAFTSPTVLSQLRKAIGSTRADI